MEVAALVVSIAALLVAVWAVFYTRWAALEAGRPTRPIRRRAARVRTEARFRLDHISPHRYVLRNGGDSNAYDVRVDVGELSVHEGSLEIDEFRPRHTQEYLLIQPLQGEVSELVVRYRDRPGSVDERIAQLPLDTQVTPTETEA